MTHSHYVTSIEDEDFEPIPCTSLTDAFAILMGKVACFYYFDRRSGVMVLVVEHAADLHIDRLAEGKLCSTNPTMQRHGRRSLLKLSNTFGQVNSSSVRPTRRHCLSVR